MESSPNCSAGKHLRFPIDSTNEQFNHLMDSTDKQLKRPVDPEECEQSNKIRYKIQEK